MKILAERIKKLRENKKISDKKFTQAYVAEAIGVARQTYTAYENGTKEPSLETVEKIADFFDVSTDYLFGRTDIMVSHRIFEERAKYDLHDLELTNWYYELAKKDKKTLTKLRKISKMIENEKD
ncbi:helix-turn-helix transcriptional regulator [Bacillus aquiflavi]|uniref:Helix-turn-helix transcriptional regulator n=1 Tax=Bacillus aquiflavi TaxID=2672567 RepID=A0A6B3W3F9_9BACI|nr:helix-turn-helix transcriptional regulator [Bacillus aquiflavi]MBA4538126.1 helix-turn-helix transcriptional regulator [Bacillus aquiflavi]NEY82446.1 helix-turn-helix transcriptional regulator [Bacillus aquiflavi]UAC48582.1 helix-turn-helix transcriptional regulator [Bacillus aquiflavi]